MNLFKRIFSRRGKEAEPLELPPEFVQADPPDWLIEIKGASLAHGNHFSIRVQMVVASRKGTVDVVILPRKEGEFPLTATMDLPRPDTDKLFVILGFSFPDQISSVSAQPSSALPVDVYIHRREPYLLCEAKCSLGGWLESKKSGPPVIEIGRILLNAAEPTLRGIDTSS